MESWSAVLDAFEAENPAAYRLALTTAFAVRVDPALARRARLAFVPGADAGVEADLWFSPLVQFRSPEGFVFYAPAADHLRHRLAADAGFYEAAWQLTEEVHRDLPPALRLEVEVSYLQHSRHPDAEARIRDHLRRALAALVAHDRRGLARWAARALPRLPEAVRALDEAQMLAAGAHLRLEGGLAPAPLPGGGALPDWMAWLTPTGTDHVEVSLRRYHGVLEVDAREALGESLSDDLPLLALPATEPLVLEVTADTEDADDARLFFHRQDEEKVREIVDVLRREHGIRLDPEKSVRWGDPAADFRQRTVQFSEASSETTPDPLDALVETARPGEPFLIFVSRHLLRDAPYLPEALLQRLGQLEAIVSYLDDETYAAWSTEYEMARDIYAAHWQEDPEVLPQMGDVLRTLRRGTTAQRLTLSPGEVRRVAVPDGPLRLRTLTGETYELRPTGELAELDRLLKTGAFEEVLRLAEDHTYVLLADGKLADAVAVCDYGLAAAQRVEDPEAVDTWLGYKGLTLAHLGRTRDAQDTFEEMLAHARRQKTPEARAWELQALRYLSCTYHDTDQPHRARELHQERLDRSRELSDVEAEANALSWLGLALAEMGDPKAGRDAVEQALSLLSRLEDHTKQGPSLGHLGHVLRLGGQVEDAAGYFREQLRMAEETDDKVQQYEAHVGLGLSMLALEDPDVALKHFSQARELAKNLGHRLREADARGHQADAYARRASVEDGYHPAVAFAREALAIYEALDHPRAEQMRERLRRLEEGPGAA